MSEINGPNFGVNQVNFSSAAKKTANSQQEETEPQITDFSDMKAETLGRSMLYKGNDSINNDLKALVDNPQIANNSDIMFEAAYTAALDNGIENPYEEAASASTTAM